METVRIKKRRSPSSILSLLALFLIVFLLDLVIKKSNPISSENELSPTASADWAGGASTGAEGYGGAEASGCEGSGSCEGCGGEGCGSGCFVAGTLVLMADGTSRPIEQVVPGDMVMSFDQFSALTPQRVSRLFVHENFPLIEVEGMKLTKDHRFLLADGSYKKMGELAVGDKIVKADGSISAITTYKELADKATVYNFTVENYHTYVAGGFRVHNEK